MIRSARIFVGIVCMGGATLLYQALYPFAFSDPLRFTGFLVAAAVASTARLPIATFTGSLSAIFLFVIAGLQMLSHSETMVLACVMTLMGCLWKPRRQRSIAEIAFEMAVAICSVSAAYSAYHNVQLIGPVATTALRLIYATIAYFVVNSILSGWMTSLTERKTVMQAWQESHLWTLPFYLMGAIAFGSPSFLNGAAGWPVMLMLLPLVALVYRHFRLHLVKLDTGKKHLAEMAELHLRTIEALALAIEAKDHNSHDQLYRVQVIATGLAESLGMEKGEIDALRAASLLHDIGKLAVPENIISKPGKLTREEFEKMKIHPQVSAQILERVKFPYPVVPTVRGHHERWNGGGYPDGLSGEKIPLGARILAVVDAFVSLTSERPHRPGIAADAAMARIALESGIQFDPRIVEILKQRYLELDGLAREQQNKRVRISADWNVKQDAAKPETPATGEAKPAQTFLSSIAAARQEAQALFELAQELGNSLSLDETLSVFGMRLNRIVPFDTIAIYVRREANLRPEYVSGENVRLFTAMHIPIGQGVSGWAAANRKPVLNGNPLMEPGYVEEPGKHHSLKCALAIPLESGAGVVGVITLYSMVRDSFTKDHLRILQAISTKVAFSIENALKYQQAESSAATDYLTGLLNARSLFLHLDSELARCRRLESPLAVLVSDLDGFKGVNDRFGHLEGNRLLQAVAQRLKESCRDYDVVARMGGDEFVLVLPGSTAESVRHLVPRLRETVKQASREVFGEDVIGFSVGESYFPSDGVDAEQLLAEADKRMYQNKSRAKMLKEQRRGFDFDFKATNV